MRVAQQARCTLVFILLAVFGLASCQGEHQDQRVLFDFESEQELDALGWSCHSLYSLATEHQSHGLKSLRLELYPSDYPGLHPKLKDNDWRQFKEFCFEAFNPQAFDVPIVVRIDDRKDNPDYQDRYNKRFVLNPGDNQIRIPLDTLITSGTDRHLNLSRVSMVVLFLSHPKEKIVLFVDYLRLQ